MKISRLAEQRRPAIVTACCILFLFACSVGPGVTATATPAIALTATRLSAATRIPTLTPHPGATPTPNLPLTETALTDKCAAVPAGLVGWWPGNGSARDVVAGNDGRLSGGVDVTTGKVRQAFRFHGGDGSLDIPRTASLNVGKQVTIEFWVKPAPGNTLDCCQGLVTTDFYLVEISSGRSGVSGVNFVVDTGGYFFGTSDKNNAAFRIPAGEWSFIVGTYDGKSLRLYVNAREEVQLAHPGRIIPMLPESFLSVGSEDGRTFCAECVGTRYFNGLIDEISIYNRALSAEEIRSISAADDAGKCIPSP